MNRSKEIEVEGFPEEDFKEEEDISEEEDPIQIKEKTRKLAEMVVSTRRMIEIFIEEENLMDTEMRVMKKKTKDKIKECLQEPALSAEEKDIMLLSIRRQRTLEE